MPDQRARRDDYASLDEIIRRSRRMYRSALKMQTEGILRADPLADLYIDSQIVATFTETLWRQSGERARAGLATSDQPTREPETVVQESEDDPPSTTEA